MKKIIMLGFSLVFFCCYYSYSATQIFVIYGDLDTLSTPLGPGFVCIPSTNICCICAAPFSFEEKAVQEHIGIFIPTVPGNPPTIGKGYTDVTVTRTVLPDGSQRYDVEVLPSNIMIYEYQVWRDYFEQK